jgi:hypothetical protein
MVDRVKTVATQSLQLWLRPGVDELGWHGPPVMLSGFVQPFDTWADMHHVLARECWADPPGALAYFCSALPDEPGPRDRAFALRMRETVRRNAVEFLDRHVVHLWPGAVDAAGRFRWELLATPRDSAATPSGPALLGLQYWTANVDPSDRYTLTLPGTARYRISPLDRTYDNLTIAGDWTDCGFISGCVEAAVMSGRLAAHALSGLPALVEITGFDHP